MDECTPLVSGSDNIISFQTKRYSDQALVIRGPGAGAEVGATGLHSSNFRLNVSAFCGIGGVFWVHLGGVWGVSGVKRGCLGCYLSHKWLRLSRKVDQCKPLGGLFTTNHYPDLESTSRVPTRLYMSTHIHGKSCPDLGRLFRVSQWPFREVTAGGVFGDVLRICQYLGAPS